MRFSMEVLLYRSRKRANRKGLAPIKVRITISGHRGPEFSTGYRVGEEQWDQDRQMICCHPQQKIWNMRLQQIKTDLYAIHLDMEMKHLPVTADRVIMIYQGRFVKRQVLTQDLLNEYEKKLAARQARESTKKIDKFRLMILRSFIGNKLLPVAMINLSFIDRYQEWLYAQYARNYANKQLQFLRHFLTWCVKYDHVSKHPMYGVRLQWKRGKKVYLVKRELANLAGYRFASKRLEEVRDLYLGQVYTGLSYCEVNGFDESRISGDWIIDDRVKSGGEYIIPVMPELRDLLKKYNGRLPVISNQKYNAYLKEIADIVGIQKHLTTHTGRKTAGRYFLDKGLSMEVVSRILGHETIRTTQRDYAEVGQDRIQDELDRAA